MPEGDDLLTADKVAALLSVSVRTVRRYADSGRLTPVRLGRSVRYRLSDVERLIAEEVDTSGQGTPDNARTRADSAPERAGTATGGQDAIEAQYRVTPAEIEQAVSRTSAQYLGDLRTVLAEVGKVYEGRIAATEAQVAAKDETIAAQRDALAELRRRAEAAEGERDALRLQLAEASVPPVVVVAGQEAPEPLPATIPASTTAQGLWARLRRALGRT